VGAAADGGFVRRGPRSRLTRPIGSQSKGPRRARAQAAAVTGGERRSAAVSGGARRMWGWGAPFAARITPGRR
jgi:hypothetical protein